MVNLDGVGPLAVDSAGALFSGDLIHRAGDIVSDVASDLAADPRARRVDQHLLRCTRDPGLCRTLEFRQELEATHSALFRAALGRVQDDGAMDSLGQTPVARRMPAVFDTVDLRLRSLGAGGPFGAPPHGLAVPGLRSAGDAHDDAPTHLPLEDALQHLEKIGELRLLRDPVVEVRRPEISGKALP